MKARGPRDAPPRDARAPSAPRDGRTAQPPHEPRASRGAGREAPRADVGTEITYGLRAGIALLARRPADVARVALGREAQLPEVEEVLAPLRGRVDVRDGLEERDLAQLAGTTHHEGLVVVARPRVWIAPAALAELLVARRGTAIALDRVRNPYNVGAILRSAAFFGIDAVLLGAPAPHPGLPPDAVRVAEGGVEHLALTRTTDLADTLGRLAQRGVAIVGAESDGSASAIGYEFRRPAVLVLGHEREGLSPRVRARCNALVAIRGSGAVESLNVAVAASVMISELCRR